MGKVDIHWICIYLSIFGLISLGLFAVGGPKASFGVAVGIFISTLIINFAGSDHRGD